MRLKYRASYFLKKKFVPSNERLLCSPIEVRGVEVRLDVLGTY